MPYATRVTWSRQLTNQNANGYEVNYWVALPFTRDFQVIRKLTVTPRPQKVITDRDGNKWAYLSFKGAGRAQRVRVQFDALMAQAAFTLPVSYRYLRRQVPGGILDRYTRETHSFDFSSLAVKAALPRVRGASTYVASLLRAREFVNRKLNIVGPSGPETKASGFLTKGEGRCYAHTLSYAAVTRGAGYPVRAIGGYVAIKTAADAGVHTWNQVYFPWRGWVDVDANADDKKSGKDSYWYFGNRLPGYVITFIGDYDTRDRRTQFAQRGWISTYTWRSLNRHARARVKLGKAAVGAQPLGSWR